MTEDRYPNAQIDLAIATGDLIFDSRERVIHTLDVIRETLWSNQRPDGQGHDGTAYGPGTAVALAQARSAMEAALGFLNEASDAQREVITEAQARRVREGIAARRVPFGVTGPPERSE